MFLTVSLAVITKVGFIYKERIPYESRLQGVYPESKDHIRFINWFTANWLKRPTAYLIMYSHMHQLWSRMSKLNKQSPLSAVTADRLVSARPATFDFDRRRVKLEATTDERQLLSDCASSVSQEETKRTPGCTSRRLASKAPRRHNASTIGTIHRAPALFTGGRRHAHAGAAQPPLSQGWTVAARDPSERPRLERPERRCDEDVKYRVTGVRYERV